MKISRPNQRIFFFHYWLAACLLPVAVNAIDKSAWPRVAPVIFSHGVGSSPATWEINQVRDVIPNDKPMWPSGDDSKSGEYSYHKPEESALIGCGSAKTGPYFLKNLGNNSLIGNNEYPCGFPATYTNYDIDGNPFEVPYTFWQNLASFPGNTQIGVSDALMGPKSSLAMNYDYLQAKWTKKSRYIQNPLNWYAQEATDPGAPVAYTKDLPSVTKRENGLEFFDAYWGMGWPDGNVPATLSGLDGMMYGTYIASGDQKWVKAKYSRRITRFSSSDAGLVANEWKTYKKADWDILKAMAANPAGTPPALTDAQIREVHGTKWGPGTAFYATLNYKITNVRDEKYGKRTVTHEWTRGGTGGLFIFKLIYTLEDNGYTGEMLVEETPYGEIGQLYITIKKVLDKYYIDATTKKPNWHLGNGNSDPQAKVVLVGHSQGGVVSRGVCYPGFGTAGQYDAALGYMPMYFPKAMINQSFVGLNGSVQTMNGQYFDPRNHIAGVITTSSPHFGSPIGYQIDGLYALHKKMIDAKNATTPGGPYVNIWGSGLLSIDNKTWDIVNGQLDGFLGVNNPTTPSPTAPTEMFDNTILTGLRNLNTTHYKTIETLNPPIPDIATGMNYWQLGTAGSGASQVSPSSPCASVLAAGNTWVNHYRLYWQPEYDNWVRSYRFNELNNGSNESYKSLKDADDFRAFGKTLCEEQIGRFTRITDKDNPNLKSPPYGTGTTSWADMAKYNPLAGDVTSSMALAKTAATASASLADDERLNNDIQTLLSCIQDAAANAKPGIVGLITSAVVPPVLNPWAYNAGVNYVAATRCYERAQYRVNQNVQSLVRGLMANGAQGLAFHPASTFLHRLNQKGGPSNVKPDERRPYPFRPDGTPIPFICIVNSLTPANTYEVPTGVFVNGDLTVNTLSQDLGFAYPDVSKSGSLVKLALVGYAHTMATDMNNTPFGPWLKADNQRDVDANYLQHETDRKMVANLIYGLAIGQSPVIMNQGAAAAKVGEIESNHTYPDAAGYKLQKNNEGVQGKYSRLKGLNPDEILEPVPLPLNAARDGFVVNSAVVVNDKEEIFLPAGSKVTFTASGSITVMSGGRLSLGGVPVYSSSAPTTYGITFIVPGNSAPALYFKTGSKLKVPDPSVSKMKSKYFVQMAGINYSIVATPRKLGDKTMLAPNHMYRAFDINPYQEAVANGNKSFKDVFVNWAAVGSALQLLLQ